jgi:hypothetical protein
MMLRMLALGPTMVAVAGGQTLPPDQAAADKPGGVFGPGALELIDTTELNALVIGSCAAQRVICVRRASPWATLCLILLI